MISTLLSPKDRQEDKAVKGVPQQGVAFLLMCYQ